MVEEMAALHSTGTWDLGPLPASKSHVDCCWVYTVKIDPDGGVDHLKAYLVTRGILKYMAPITTILFLMLPI